MIRIPRLIPLGFAMAAALLVAGCSTPIPEASRKIQYRRIATPPGVRIISSGEAVAEVDASMDLLFSTAESLIRRDYRVTFINRSIRQIEGATQSRQIVLKVRQLTTGKTGLSVAITSKEDKIPMPEAARDFVAKLIPPTGGRLIAPGPVNLDLRN